MDPLLMHSQSSSALVDVPSDHTHDAARRPAKSHRPLVRTNLRGSSPACDGLPNCRCGLGRVNPLPLSSGNSFGLAELTEMCSPHLLRTLVRSAQRLPSMHDRTSRTGVPDRDRNAAHRALPESWADEPACKPDPVPGLAAGGRSSIWACRRRQALAVYPQARAGRPRTPAQEPGGSLLDLAPGGVYLATPVTRGAGGLLPHRFTLTWRSPARRSVLCGTVPRVAPGCR